MSRFKVFFEQPSTSPRPNVVWALAPSHWTISDMNHGFWINDAGQITHRMDRKHWIPPSRVRYVESA